MTRADWEKSYVSAESALRKSGVNDADLLKLEEVRVRFMGRKGALTELLKSLKDLSIEDKRELGPKAQALKATFDAAIETRKAALEDQGDAAALEKDAIDLTLPSIRPPKGRLHPLTTTLHEIARIFQLMGYSWAEGPHVEDERHNFTALNIPADHPARDSQDTFYLQDLPLLLRTHTSPVQVRTMESVRPPLRVVCPGRVFRHEQLDATHSAVFGQVEGLVIDEGIGLADLKGHLQTFLQKLLGASTKTRFRPSYFPFTEPSTEVDVKCFFCPGTGCPSCKHTGWIEILGAGVVNPAVLKAVGYDENKWSGFAFGIGVERVAMLLHGVRDLRHFYTNDQRFLKQFDESLL
ncbi:MAG: phenylalanine--tRNA ligase subunit alpha [Elusimicrobia bacterium CG11_big_fil_rev_8_21_14_0_20_64_6]|nr:MAG: phenylalanine--tRNA ligase subunit alpha [Elusimicrobia bacterium CG11_big_fil_rev_8_21_14_0_20_64_6]